MEHPKQLGAVRRLVVLWGPLQLSEELWGVLAVAMDNKDNCCTNISKRSSVLRVSQVRLVDSGIKNFRLK